MKVKEGWVILLASLKVYEHVNCIQEISFYIVAPNSEIVRFFSLVGDGGDKCITNELLLLRIWGRIGQI